MRILILANNDVGLYKFRKELIEELIVQGNEIYVSLPYGELIPEIEKLGTKFISTPIDRRGINPFTDIKLVIRYIRMMIMFKPDLVITYTIKPNIYGGLASRLFKRKYVVNITGLGTAFQIENIVKKMVCMLYKISCKKARTVFFENEENKQLFVKNKLIKEDQAYRLNGAGVNLEEYPYTEYPDVKEPIRFLFVGRVMKEKGVDELFAAAKEIKKEHPDVIFDIVGPMEDAYGQVIQELETAGIIQYHGYQKDVKRFIAKCHCFVLPSWHEGMANTNLECSSMGRPVITSNIYGCKEAVVENVSGFLCEPKDSQSLYAQIKKFINLPYDNKVQMGKQSRKHMEDIFDKKKVVNETVKELKL